MLSGKNLLAAAAAFVASAGAQVAEPFDAATVIEASEQHLLVAEFDAADAVLTDALPRVSDESETLSLLLQRLRVGQGAQLSGVSLADQAPIIAEAERLAASEADTHLAGLAKLRTTTSRYFAILVMGIETGDFGSAAELVDDFEQTANGALPPCPQANALFFAATRLMRTGSTR